MKKFLLSLIAIVGLTISFSSAQFMSTIPGSSCYQTGYCSLQDFSRLDIDKTGSINLVLTIGTKSYIDNGYGSNIYLAKNSLTFEEIEAQFRNNGWGTVSRSKFFRITSVGNGVTIDKVSLKYSSSSMPVSELTPVINGLSSAVYEFIPYVIYIGLAVLGAIIGFVGIKRLINRVRAKIFSAFK